MPSRPPALPVLLATITLVLLAGAWWIVQPDAPPSLDGVEPIGAAARESSAARGAIAETGPGPGGCGPTDAADGLAWQAPGPERLVAGAGLLAVDRVDELVTDLRMLRPSSRFAGSEAGVVRRLEQFVFDVHAADQVSAAVAALERRLDDLSAPHAEPRPADSSSARTSAPLSVRSSVQLSARPSARRERTGEPRHGSDDWLSARLLVAAAGLGATEPVIARFSDVVAVERADVLLSLGWDPMAPGDAPRLEARRADDLVRGMPLLPLVLSRPPTADVVAFLSDRLDEPTRGLHGMRERDASVLVLGVGIGQRSECLPLIEASLRADPLGSFVALFTLVGSEDPAARSLLGHLRSRYASNHPLPTDDLTAHERFAMVMGNVLVAARGDELFDLPALRKGMLPGRDRATRLESAAGVLARISDGVPQIDTRKVLSDMLVGALVNERERDVAWLELLALRQLHIEEAWLPSRTIGYGSEDGLDIDRAAQRTDTFLASLSDPDPATRRLAVFGLLGSSDGREIEPALTAALAVEEDGRIAQWMRLALIRL
ncbi:MAG: hypothetical protein ACYTG2_01685 [Planctomycetota bacterium]|jgi:hypothetical protein